MAAVLEPALRQMAGQGPVAVIQAERLTSNSVASLSVLDRIGIRRFFVMVALVMLVAMISMLALPVILVEEVEKKTLDALALVASYADVVAGKTLVGGAFITLSSVLLLGVTRVRPANPLLFGAGALLFSVTLVGFDLLVGSLFHNANQLNTWSGFILLPVIGRTFAVATGLPKALETAFSFLPSPRAMELIINGLSGEAIFPHVWLSALIVAAWGLVAYSLVLWRLAHQTA